MQVCVCVCVNDEAAQPFSHRWTSFRVCEWIWEDKNQKHAKRIIQMKRKRKKSTQRQFQVGTELRGRVSQFSIACVSRQ